MCTEPQVRICNACHCWLLPSEELVSYALDSIFAFADTYCTSQIHFSVKTYRQPLIRRSSGLRQRLPLPLINASCQRHTRAKPMRRQSAGTWQHLDPATWAALWGPAYEWTNCQALRLVRGDRTATIDTRSVRRRYERHPVSVRKKIVCAVLFLGVLSGAGTNAQTPTHTVPTELSCKGDQVVWVNTRSGVYHYHGERYFGSTKQGKFVCEKEALREGDRSTRNGQ
jgi:hypothetical protein